MARVINQSKLKLNNLYEKVDTNKSKYSSYSFLIGIIFWIIAFCFIWGLRYYYYVYQEGYLTDYEGNRASEFMSSPELYSLFALVGFGFSLCLFMGYFMFSMGSILLTSSKIDLSWERLDAYLQNLQINYKKEFQLYFGVILIIGIIEPLLFFANLEFSFNGPGFFLIYIINFILMLFLNIGLSRFIIGKNEQNMATLIAQEKRRINMLQNYHNSILYMPLNQALSHFEFRTREEFADWIQIKAQNLTINENNLYNLR